MKNVIISIFILFSVLASAKQIKIAVIDTGINKNFVGKLCGMKDFTGYGINDVNGHGTNVASLIAKEMKDTDYCLHIIKYYHTAKTSTNDYTISNKAFKHAIDLDVDAINFSSYGFESNLKEFKLIFEAIWKGIKVFVPSGNERKNLDEKCNVYPACYFNNLKVIGRSDTDYNGYGSVVNYKENGAPDEAGGKKLSGTSQATAITCGKVMSKK